MRDRQSEIRMLEDTLQILKQGWYEKDGKKVRLQLSPAEMEEIQVFLPEDVRRNGGSGHVGASPWTGGCRYSCENMDSFTMVRMRLAEDGPSGQEDSRILVLNLANPVNPGGGVRRGARAQEEDLCRKSSLLLSLESREARKYYEYNRSLNTCMGSDALMVTPQVEILKDENGELLDATVVVSVLTCAAPMVFGGKEGLGEAEYEGLVYNRILGMLQTAAALGYRRLVLGAWGCGAFGNDAHVVSDLFNLALKELDHSRHGGGSPFQRVDFAVLSRTRDQYNLNEFRRNFSV